jgi:hypothetical protein
MWETMGLTTGWVDDSVLIDIYAEENVNRTVSGLERMWCTLLTRGRIIRSREGRYGMG